MIGKPETDAIAEWAASKDAVAAVWLFGSRAKGTHRPDSDYDLALELQPKRGEHDWAFGDYIFEADAWKAEIVARLGAPISLIPFRDDLIGKFDPRIEGMELWRRAGAS